MMPTFALRAVVFRPAAVRAAVSAQGVRSLATAAGAGEYDVVIVGGGPGGYVAAIKAGQLGLRTACVESRGALGGTCLNVGCIPSKALLHASHMYHEAQHGMAGLGINIEGNISMDIEKMMATKDKTVKGLTGGIAGLLKKNKVDYIQGYGTLTGGNAVAVKGQNGQEDVTLSTKNVVIATGSVPAPLPSAPVDNAAGRVVDSTGALELKSVPEHLVVVGGGVIGLEMGSVWRRLGSKVTVVEFLDKIVPGTDLEIVKEFQKNLKKQGFKFMLSTKVSCLPFVYPRQVVYWSNTRELCVPLVYSTWHTYIHSIHTYIAYIHT
jgi:dihydrolipoamide dehydrogenase